MPTTELQEQSLDSFLVCRDERGVVGAVGFEFYGEAVLLRSLVVAPEARNQRIGANLAHAAEMLAHRQGAKSIYLLTTNATNYFAARGYRVIAREDAPPAIQQSTQFSAVCPSTAILMVRP